jgi:RNA polymerase sigma factor (TIGR02999 family)
MSQVALITVPQREAPALRDSVVRRVAGTATAAGAVVGEGRSTGRDAGVACSVSRSEAYLGVESPEAPPAGARFTGTAPACEVLVNEVDDSVTGLLRAWTAGDGVAGDRLFSRVYGELRTIARRLRRSSTQRGDDTLDTTALVHEVYLRLAGANGLTVQNRAHFFAVAVRASRQIISNYARDAQALKRGGAVVIEPIGDTDLPLASSVAAPDDLSERVIALEEALQALEQLHPRPCRVVECRYFGGLSIAETALALDISEATVKRDWTVAQAWLHQRLRSTEDTDVR